MYLLSMFSANQEKKYQKHSSQNFQFLQLKKFAYFMGVCSLYEIDHLGDGGFVVLE